MTVSEQIIQVINVLCEKFGIVIDWTGANVIPYIEVLCSKLVTYEICTSIAWMVTCMLLSIGSIVATKKLAPTFKRGLEANARSGWDCGWEVCTGFAIAGLIFLNVITILVIGCQTMDIIKCLTFPEMYVFEYISALMK